MLTCDVDGCVVQPISQGQFTPLPEALCWVVWELSLAERSTTLDDVTAALGNAFPDLVPPANKIIYDTLGKLIRDRKIFYNGKGYGVVTPDTYRKTAVVENGEKGLLLTSEEALARAHGTVESYPQGNVVHKAIQTNLVDVICRGNGTEKVLYGRSADELEALGASTASSASRRPRLQRQRSLRMFHGAGSKRLSWSEYRSGSGSLRLSASRAKKLMDEAASGVEWADDAGVADLTDHSVKTHKEKASLLSRLFRRRSPSKKRTTLCSFSAQFPPAEWTDPAGDVAHLHSVTVQTHAADLAASIAQQETQSNKYGTLSARSDCSTSICFSSPAPTRRSMQRRVTLSEAPSVRSESCSPYRQPASGLMTKLNHDETPVMQSARARGSPATSVSSGLGRSFSPASASYQRPLGILCNQSPPSPTQSTDSLYSSSVGPSASAMCRSPVPSITSKTTTFSHDRPFQRCTPGRASYGAGGRYRTDNQPSATDYQPFQRLAARSASLRQSGDRHVLLGSSTPRPYVPGKLTEQRSLIAQQKSAMRDHFFQTQLSAPPLISSVLNNNNNNSPNRPKLSLPRSGELSNSYFSCLLSNGNKARTVSPAARSVVSSSASANKKYYETDLDLTIKVPKKSVESYQEAKKSSSESPSRVINISVTKSESLSYVSQQNETNAGHVTATNKEKTDDADKPVISVKSGEDNFRTFPSLTELNINFKSITGQKILQGLNSNSTDTLVELSMRDAEVGANAEISYV
uniref:EOG090X0BW7 n=1 Tax=Moina brachiata TaxID=675436 RepID=A0A4Y7NJ14_9CRUS|nr:EOG090X0BW7 [Moina brachiata]